MIKNLPPLSAKWFLPRCFRSSLHALCCNWTIRAMAAGSISLEEFSAYMAVFLDISALNNDTWFSKTPKNDPQSRFLVKKTAYCLSLNTAEAVGRLEDNAVCDFHVDDDESTLDTGVCSALSSSETSKMSMWEYHIVYSPSYGVPVLYFNANWQGRVLYAGDYGTYLDSSDGRLLTLEEVWRSVPVYYQQRLQHERWSFITQQEHPVLQRPFFQLHPCHTSTLMEQVLGKNLGDTNYLVTWLSSVGPVVHLTVPFSYLTTSKQGPNKTTHGESLPS